MVTEFGKFESIDRSLKNVQQKNQNSNSILNLLSSQGFDYRRYFSWKASLDNYLVENFCKGINLQCFRFVKSKVLFTRFYFRGGKKRTNRASKKMYFFPTPKIFVCESILYQISWE